MTTQSFPLKLQNGHLFTGISDQTFLLDTDAPTRFGTDSSVTLRVRIFNLPSTYRGLSASSLSNLVQNLITGIPDVDIVNQGVHPLLWDAMQKPTCSVAWLTEPGLMV
jgi:hypothetical protein